MRFSCPHCGKALNVKDDLAGKKAKCPGCRNVFVVPPTVSAAGAAPAARRKASAASRCPNCDQPLAPGAILCVGCGYDARTGRIIETRFGDG